MNKRDIELDKVHKAIAENLRLFNMWKLNAIMSEQKIDTTDKLLKNEERLYKDKVNKLNLARTRAIKNAKESHAKLDELLKEKETLHIDLKTAIHFGKVQCEHCNNYFTPQGITRHRESCASKPEIKIEKDHRDEMKEHKDDLQARKAALEKELEELKKATKSE